MSAGALDELTLGPGTESRIKVEVDDMWQLLLDFGDARLATLTSSYTVAATRLPQLEIHGLEGSVATELLDCSAPVLIGTADGTWQEHNVEPGRTSPGPDHILGVLHMVECVRTSTKPAAGAPQASHVLRVLEAAHRAARSGETQVLPVEPEHAHSGTRTGSDQMGGCE